MLELLDFQFYIKTFTFILLVKVNTCYKVSMNKVKRFMLKAEEENVKLLYSGKVTRAETMCL